VWRRSVTDSCAGANLRACWYVHGLARWAPRLPFYSTAGRATVVKIERLRLHAGELALMDLAVRALRGSEGMASR